MENLPVGFSQACHPSVQITGEGVWWCFGPGHCSLLVSLEPLWQQDTFEGAKVISLHTIKDRRRSLPSLESYLRFMGVSMGGSVEGPKPELQ